MGDIIQFPASEEPKVLSEEHFLDLGDLVCRAAFGDEQARENLTRFTAEIEFDAIFRDGNQLKLGTYFKDEDGHVRYWKIPLAVIPDEYASKLPEYFVLPLNTR